MSDQNDQPLEGQSFETKAIECAVKAGAAAVKSSAHVSKKRLARRGAMSGDDPKQIVELPKAEIVPEERARRLKSEVDRLASLPVVEWRYYVECTDVAEKHGVSRTVMKAMVEATIKPTPDEQLWFNQFRVGIWPSYFAGVQFSLDEAPLGPEDMTAPYSTTWNTAQSAAGRHKLLA